MLRSSCRVVPVLLALGLALPGTAPAQPPFLVEDIHIDGVRPSAPASQLTGLGTNLFFVYDDGVHGREIWKSDGIAAGTALLIDLCPGACSSAPRLLTVSNGVLLFIADDGIHGAELWKSDGTADGTVLVADIRPGMRGSFPGILGLPAFFGGSLDVDGVLFFAADDGESGRELWKSDGTPEGTVLVRDIRPGPNSSDPLLWAAAEGVLLLNADDGTHHREPWVSDGTTAGTILLEDINPFGSSTFGVLRPAGGPDAIAAPGGGFLFTAFDDSHGAELWKTDGTPAGTTLVKDISSGGFASSPAGLAALGSMVYFSASEGMHGRELLKTDGTEAGTVLVKDINPGTPDSNPGEITPSGDRLFFRAFDQSHGDELWSSDGTAAGTLLIRDLVPGPMSGLSFPPNAITAFGGGVLFFTGGLQLWRSDGTAAGTLEVPGSTSLLTTQSDEDTWAVVDGSFFFSTFGHGTPELYVSDGTRSDLVLTGSPAPAWSLRGDDSFLPSYNPFVAQGDRFLFTATHSVSLSPRLWASDATPAGTEMLVSSTSADSLTPVGGLTFLILGLDLATTDGTPTGTQVLPSNAAPTGGITALGSSVIYPCGNVHPLSTWLCRSDGTPGGTRRVTESVDIAPSQLTASGSAVFFNNGFATVGQLWKSDGTEEGTLQIRQWTGEDSLPDRLTDVVGTLFFSAFTESEGRELWKSDGTEPGTVLVKDILPGQGSSIDRASNPGGSTAAVGGTLLFVADDGTSGRELWKSDGTEPGTVLVKDIAPGSTGSFPFWLTRVGSLVYFAADDGVHGRELWVSDGTEAGTRMLADLLPGRRSSMPQHLEALGDLLLFAALHPSGGLEPWRSDGTVLGTRLLGDIAPGLLPSSPFAFTRAGSHVFFGANDTTTGFEPWAVPLSNVLATFADVTTDHWAWRFVEALAGAGLTGGCGQGQYCPDQAVTRAEAAVFVVRGVHGSTFVPPPATGTVFADVPASFWAAPWIEQLAADGLTRGCNLTPPLYCPERHITRAEIAVLLLRAKHGNTYTPPPATGTVFTDVPVGYWAPWIEQLAAEGITGGCAPGLYCPDNPVTRAEMAVFLTRTFNLSLP